MTVSIQLTNFRGIVQNTYVVDESLDQACLTAERLSRTLSTPAKALFVGNVEVL